MVTTASSETRCLWVAQLGPRPPSNKSKKGTQTLLRRLGAL